MSYQSLFKHYEWKLQKENDNFKSFKISYEIITLFHLKSFFHELLVAAKVLLLTLQDFLTGKDRKFKTKRKL